MPDQPNTPLDPPPVTPPSQAGPTRRPTRPGGANTWTQEDEDRYQAKRQRALARARTRRRQGLSFFVIVLAVVLVGLLGAAINQGVVKVPFGASAPTPCPTGEALPKPADITVNVYNATTKAGLASTASKELAARGYKTGQVGNAAEALRNFPDPAQVHHGPDAEEAAKAVAVQVAGAKLVADPNRTDGTVDLLLGQSFTTLVAPDVATKALAASDVKSPEGCVPAT